MVAVPRRPSAPLPSPFPAGDPRPSPCRGGSRRAAPRGCVPRRRPAGRRGAARRCALPPPPGSRPRRAVAPPEPAVGSRRGRGGRRVAAVGGTSRARKREAWGPGRRAGRRARASRAGGRGRPPRPDDVPPPARPPAGARAPPSPLAARRPRPGCPLRLRGSPALRGPAGPLAAAAGSCSLARGPPPGGPVASRPWLSLPASRRLPRARARARPPRRDLRSDVATR